MLVILQKLKNVANDTNATFTFVLYLLVMATTKQLYMCCLDVIQSRKSVHYDKNKYETSLMKHRFFNDDNATFKVYSSYSDSINISILVI